MKRGLPRYPGMGWEAWVIDKAVINAIGLPLLLFPLTQWKVTTQEWRDAQRTWAWFPSPKQ